MPKPPRSTQILSCNAPNGKPKTQHPSARAKVKRTPVNTRSIAEIKKHYIHAMSILMAMILTL